MAGPNYPSISELHQLQFLPPAQFDQANRQIGLANQFGTQGLEQGAANLQQSNLQNLYQEQADPMRLEGLRLGNIGTGFDNQSKGVKADLDVSLQAENKAAQRAKMLATASDEDLKRLMAQAQAEMLNPDEAIAARGKKKMEASWEETTRRNKAADELKKTQVSADARLEGIREAQTNMNLRNTETVQGAAERARIAADAKNKAIANKANGNPKNAENAAVYYQMQSDATDDPEEKARNAELAVKYGKYSLALKSANAGTKPDITQFGIATNPVNMGVGAQTPGGKAAYTTTGNEKTSVQNAVDGAANITPEQIQHEIETTKTMLAASKGNTPADIAERKGMQEYLTSLQKRAAPTVAPKAATPTKALVAPAGRVVIYKDGKAVGSIPEAQADAAVKQGYSLK
jgi:hypothetical protein